MATQTNLAMIRKLQMGINNTFPEERITYNTTQFYSNDQKRMITLYIIKKTIVSDTEKNQYLTLFKAASQLQVVMFMRDYWYLLNGWELPTDNEVWNEIREKIEIFQDWDAYRQHVSDGVKENG